MKFFFLFFALIASTIAISCYSRKAYGNTKTTIIKDMKFCYALFSADGRMYSFNGMNSDPMGFHGLIWHDEAKDVCQLKEYENFDGKPYPIFVCICEVSFCNTPMPFDEFQKNGYRLSTDH
ncbi:unnamed protein product [Caenorhabditis brenneri]